MAVYDPASLEAARTVMGSHYKSHLRVHKDSSRQNRPALQCRLSSCATINEWLIIRVVKQVFRCTGPVTNTATGGCLIWKPQSKLSLCVKGKKMDMTTCQRPGVNYINRITERYNFGLYLCILNVI